MMIGHPFFGHYGDNDDFGHYGYHNNPRQRQVEARRRAEIERYHRMKALEEQERSRQRQANVRKIRIQQKRQEEERRHRQRRLELERTHLRQAEDGEVPRNGLVRGSDGRIYLVALDQNGRLLFWAKSENQSKADFFFQNNEYSQLDYDEKSTYSEAATWAHIKERFTERQCRLMVVENTASDIFPKKLGMRSYVVISPDLQPLHLEEHLSFLSGKRLENINSILELENNEKVIKLSKKPHPFP